jgi:hypothetical protein
MPTETPSATEEITAKVNDSDAGLSTQNADSAATPAAESKPPARASEARPADGPEPRAERPPTRVRTEARHEHKQGEPKHGEHKQGDGSRRLIADVKQGSPKPNGEARQSPEKQAQEKQVLEKQAQEKQAAEAKLAQEAAPTQEAK